jgi:hypothetical protein
MPKIPNPINHIAALIDEYHEDKNRHGGRPHLGASQLGHHCDRWLWLSFRWAVVEQFEGRVLRLFRRGQNEELTIVKDLRAIGIDIRGVTGNQSRVNFGAHVSGSMDGIIHSGVPEAPHKKHLAEFKTASDKKFKEMVDKGLEKANPVYFAQCQVYMRGGELDRALFLMVNKNDDSIYTERVRLNKAVADKFIQRGRGITLSERIPEPCSTDPSWWLCRFCAAHSFCHDNAPTKEVNCRTCAHSTPLEDSWECARYETDIRTKWQYDGCNSHVLHPDLVPWKRKESPYEYSAVYEIDGVDLVNGQDGWQSIELLSNLEVCKNPPDEIMALRANFDGVITG